MKIIKNLIVGLLLLSFGTGLKAQYTTVGQGVFGGTVAGPVRLSVTDSLYFSHYAYIYPSSLISGLQHGDTIQSFEFSTLAGFVPLSGVNIDVYARNTTATDFGAAPRKWDNLRSASKLVHAGSLVNIIDGTAGFKKFEVNNNPWVYDTTKGKNIEILVDYRQTQRQAGLVQFDYDNTNLNYAVNSCKYYLGNVKGDSLRNSAQFHPQLRLNFPRKVQELAITAAYSLGKMPVPLGNPDSIKVLVRNVGKKAIVNKMLYLRIMGANARYDSTAISLATGEERFISLKTVNVNKFGIDSILVSSPLGMPAFDSAWTFRNDNFNVYSYENPVAPGNAGGIGFNGATGDFVARFYSNTPKSINQITVSFGQGGRPFRIGIWKDNGSGSPDSLLWLSDSLTSVGGKYILDIKKPVKVSGPFFCGVRQLGLNNVAFGYQPEQPVRPNTFLYTSPFGSTNWVDFAPDAPFRFLIEPRIQADTDLVVSAISRPLDTFNTAINDSIQPICTIKNIGLNDVKTNATVRCILRSFGRVYYDETVQDTLSSGATRSIVFPKRKFNGYVQINQAVFIVKHPNDQVKDNDTLIKTFYVGIDKDVGWNTAYEPTEGQLFRYQLDTIRPLALFNNFGYENSPIFNIRCKIHRGDSVVPYNRVITTSITGNNSRFLLFPDFLCTDTGRFEVRFTTEMPGDRFKSNDTIRRNIFIYKQRDLALIKQISPLSSAGNFYKLYQPLALKAKAENQGLIEEFNAKMYARITASNGAIFRDTATYGCLAKETVDVNFSKTYIPQKKGYYQALFITKHPSDLYPKNDSLAYQFIVGYPYDYGVSAINYPPNNFEFNKVNDSTMAPRATFVNNGFLRNAGTSPIVCEIWKNGIRVYYDIKSTSLDTGQTVSITFPKTFDLSKAGQYTLRCMTNFAGDLFRKNDTLEHKFTVIIGQDAEVRSIDKPLSSFALISKDSVMATVQNNGKNDMTGLTLMYAINGQVRDSLMFGLSAYEQKEVTFNVPYAPQVTGTNSINVFFARRPDTEAQNDSLSQQIVVSKKQDLAIAVLPVFCTNNYIAKGDSIYPAIRVNSLGVEMVRNRNLFVQVQEIGQISPKFTEKIVIDSMPSLSQRTFVTINPIRLNKVARYEIKTWLEEDSNDKYVANDSGICQITVAVNSTKTPSWSQQVSLFPNPAQDIVQVQNAPYLSKISLWSSNGKLVSHNLQNSIALQKLNAGMYFVKIEYNGYTATLKLLKE
jgi:hypothetical protein